MKSIDSLLSRYRRMRLNEERRVKRQAIINVTPADRREQALALFEVRCMIEDTHPDYFNMATFFAGEADDAADFTEALNGHICNSTACIAGFAVARFDKDFKTGYVDQRYIDYEAKGRDLLHLTRDQANRLFFGKYGPDAEYIVNKGDLDEVTKEQALFVLDHLIATGNVRWDLATGVADA